MPTLTRALLEDGSYVGSLGLPSDLMWTSEQLEESLACTLRAKPDGISGNGVALRISEAMAPRELGLLWVREMAAGTYHPRWEQVLLQDGRQVTALVFVVNRQQALYASDACVGVVARLIALAAGSLGSNAEYVCCLGDALADAGLDDLHRCACLRVDGDRSINLTTAARRVSPRKASGATSRQPRRPAWRLVPHCVPPLFRGGARLPARPPMRPGARSFVRPAEGPPCADASRAVAERVRSSTRDLIVGLLLRSLGGRKSAEAGLRRVVPDKAGCIRRKRLPDSVVRPNSFYKTSKLDCLLLSN